MHSNFYFFFGSEDPLSNWHRAVFYIKGIRFAHVEQFMMYCKAKLFKDEKTAQALLLTTDPKRCKELGREVRGYVEKIWSENREHYVYIGALAKFRQNKTLGSFLLTTKEKELVEASKYDRIWGVGLSADNPLILDRRNWRGSNKLGKCLMKVRATLQLSNEEVAFLKEKNPCESFITRARSNFINSCKLDGIIIDNESKLTLPEVLDKYRQY